MHLFDAEAHNMGGHGIVGGQLPLGVGLAFAQHYKKSGGVTFTFMGDGAINQGSFNESLNLAALWELPHELEQDLYIQKHEVRPPGDTSLTFETSDDR